MERGDNLMGKDDAINFQSGVRQDLICLLDWKALGETAVKE